MTTMAFAFGRPLARGAPGPKLTWLAAAVALTLICSVVAVDFENCAADSKDLCDWMETKVSGCGPEDEYCTLRRGRNVSITINFSLRRRVLRATTVVHGIVAGIPMPFTSSDACVGGTGLSCPLSVGNHTYTFNLPVKRTYPRMKVKVKWELQNERKKSFVCVLIPSRIL